MSRPSNEFDYASASPEARAAMDKLIRGIEPLSDEDIRNFGGVSMSDRPIEELRVEINEIAAKIKIASPEAAKKLGL